ncbi:hypothetical protein BDV93DRAFT_603697 [Ceratobasidium sp. AG-I]|nr:hypothetical protein BDV93DRAFT_603697 [Ceratobasidium sp. AG-I]
MSTTLPPWDQLTFSFGWSVDGTSSLQQCRNVTFDYYNSVGENIVSNPPPSAPYSLVLYGAGYEPLKVPLNNTALQGSFKWTPNLPIGTSYALSMKDAKDYTGGILTPMFKMATGTGCNLASPMTTSSLDVAVTGNSQCGQSIVSVNNGTAPYTVEVVPADNRQQKTVHFASSPFSLVLDISEGVDYFLAVYDSAGHSSVEGLYTVGSSSDNSCLGAATTVTAGKFSTLYPGGTAAASSAASTSTSTATPSPKLASPAIIGMGVGIPVVVLIIAGLFLWLCYKRNRRQRAVDSSEKLEIDQFDPPAAAHSYTPVATAFPYNSTTQSGSHYDISNGSISQHPPVPVPYPYPMDSSDRHTLNTVEGSSTSGYDRASTAISEKRRHMFTPNLQSVDAEPFDPYNAAAGPADSSQSAMPPLPPAYSPASRPP